ncbi:MAG TPA: SEC-C metal-binding domain-containing protein [Syntrophomonas sp.]|nr:SEC-C metal-binding domain-containing protein [Syntrophomonas sp.]
MSFLPLNDPCPCGSGKEYGQCCAPGAGCQVIHFPRGKRNNFRAIIEEALGDLILYARRYFPNWDSVAQAKFLSYSQGGGEIHQKFAHIFWQWYVLNYRFYSDVSPLIDFYLVEMEDILTERMKTVYAALQHSYLSIYTVSWVRNNTVAVTDLFCGDEHIIERDFGSVTQFIEQGSLLYGRIVKLENASIVIGRPVIVTAEQKSYLLDEVNAVYLSENSRTREDMREFLRECAEVTAGLVMDVVQGIKKNRVKSKTLHLESRARKALLYKLNNSQHFDMLERHNHWLKFTWKEGQGIFKRLYVGEKALLVSADESADILYAARLLEEMLAVEQTEFVWQDGIILDDGEQEEDIQTELMVDKNLEDWLKLPHPELADMTPLEAMQDIKGRVLLENLLTDMEMLELIARSRGEYNYPTAVIRRTLGLDKNALSREMSNPQAIAIKVEKLRNRQLLSSYVTAYNWLSSEYAQVAATIYDIYSNGGMDQRRLAWLLYLWCEFTTVYRPRVSRIHNWIAALEFTLSNSLGEDISYTKLSRAFGISTGMVSRSAYIVNRHFEKYPPNFKTEMIHYPSWEELDHYEMVQSYEEVYHHLSIYSYTIGNRDPKTKTEVQTAYYQPVNTRARFWDELNKKIYGDFFEHHYLLDHINANGSTIMNTFWDNQANRFPPYLREAAFRFMMSYVGAYRIKPAGKNSLIFEDVFSGEEFEVYGRFGDNVHENIVPGMIGICRLLPLEKLRWVSDPMFIVLQDMQDIFERNLEIMTENLAGYDASDPLYLKKRGEFLVKAYIRSIDEFEQAALNLVNQPLQPEWQYAYVSCYEKAHELISSCKHFRPLYQDHSRSSYMWDRFSVQGNYQWGYLLVKDNAIIISAPPGKDMHKFTKDIRRAFKCADLVLAFRPAELSRKVLKELEVYMVADLANYFDQNPAQSLILLRQDTFNNEEKEWQQGIFLLKLGSLLMDYLENKKKNETKQR